MFAQDGRGFRIPLLEHASQGRLPIVWLWLPSKTFAKGRSRASWVSTQNCGNEVETVVIESVKETHAGLFQQLVAQSGLIEEIGPADGGGIVEGFAQF